MNNNEQGRKTKSWFFRQETGVAISLTALVFTIGSWIFTSYINHKLNELNACKITPGHTVYVEANANNDSYIESYGTIEHCSERYQLFIIALNESDRTYYSQGNLNSNSTSRWHTTFEFGKTWKGNRAAFYVARANDSSFDKQLWQPDGRGGSSCKADMLTAKEAGNKNRSPCLHVFEEVYPLITMEL